MNTPDYPVIEAHANRAEAVAAFWAVLAPHLVSHEGAPETLAA